MIRQRDVLMMRVGNNLRMVYWEISQDSFILCCADFFAVKGLACTIERFNSK